MSEEEKKAIENLKEVVDLYNDECLITTDYDFKSIEILLNLIEKQEKEIKRLEARRYMYNAETGEISQIPLNNNYISKDKIKAKIEEIDIEIQCCEYADDDTEEYKQDIEKEKRRLLRDKAVLQSLLLEE